MKYALIFTTLLTGCFDHHREELKFHYGDNVQILDGFYKGCIGTAEDFGMNRSYEIQLHNECGYYKPIIDETNLRLIEGRK